MTGAQGPIVVKLGGLAVDTPQRAGELLGAVAFAHRQDARGIVLVHGGGRAVDEHLARLGLETVRREGLRVTGDTEIGEVVAVLAGRVNKSIVGTLQSRGARAVGLCLGDGLTARAARHAPGGVDIGHVGEVTGGDPTLLRILLSEGFLPVVGPIALDEQGRALNINGDDAASAVASIINARLLVLLTDVPGVLDEHGAIIPSLDADSAESLISRAVISGGMIPKVRSALRAAERAGVPAVIASWNEPGAIAAVAAGQPAGTRFDPPPADNRQGPVAR